MIRRAAYTLSLIVILGLIGLSVSAAVTREQLDLEQRGDFIISPGKTEVVVDPGETATKNLTITNRTGAEVTFALDIEDFKGSNNPNQAVVLLGDEEGPYSLKNFIIPEVREVTVAQGEKVTIPIEIAIPEDAEPRGYYGAVVVSNKPQVDKRNEDGGSTAKIVSRIASLMLVRVSGDVTEEGTVKDFSFLGPEKKILQKHPEGFELQFQNTGNVHLVPYGKITVSNIFGATVHAFPVDAFFALPDSVRYEEVLWDSDSFMLGRYTATANIQRGYGDIVDTENLVFWVLPVRIIVPVILGILIFLLLAYYILTHFELKKKS